MVSFLFDGMPAALLVFGGRVMPELLTRLSFGVEVAGF
jgi:hypothetical protein